MYIPNNKVNIVSYIMIFIGVLSATVAFISDTHAAWTNLLFNNYFFLGISLFAVFCIW